MENDLSIKSSINLDNRINYFNFHMDQSTKYYIAGIDYKSPNVEYENKHNIILDNLKTRKIYYELHNDNEKLIVIIILKKNFYLIPQI